MIALRDPQFPIGESPLASLSFPWGLVGTMDHPGCRLASRSETHRKAHRAARKGRARHLESCLVTGP
jgi:hypothetical protein